MTALVGGPLPYGRGKMRCAEQEAILVCKTGYGEIVVRLLVTASVITLEEWPYFI